MNMISRAFNQEVLINTELYHHCLSEDWSDQTDAQFDLGLLWSDITFRWFCHNVAKNFVILFIFATNKA